MLSVTATCKQLNKIFLLQRRIEYSAWTMPADFKTPLLNEFSLCFYRKDGSTIFFQGIIKRTNYWVKSLNFKQIGNMYLKHVDSS